MIVSTQNGLIHKPIPAAQQIVSGRFWQSEAAGKNGGEAQTASEFAERGCQVATGGRGG